MAIICFLRQQHPSSKSRRYLSTTITTSISANQIRNRHELSVFPEDGNKSISTGYKHEHESDAIFGLPSFRVDVITDHDQPVRVYVSSGDKVTESWPHQTPNSPHIVECSLESHFYDSLYVTMDVGLIFFLHEIIQTYMMENETAAAQAAAAATGKLIL